MVLVRIMTSSAHDMARGADSQMTSRSTRRTVQPTTDEMICPPASRMVTPVNLEGWCFVG